MSSLNMIFALYSTDDFHGETSTAIGAYQFFSIKTAPQTASGVVFPSHALFFFFAIIYHSFLNSR